jgi:hypothetical protein
VGNIGGRYIGYLATSRCTRYIVNMTNAKRYSENRNGFKNAGAGCEERAEWAAAKEFAKYAEEFYQQHGIQLSKEQYENIKAGKGWLEVK